MRSGKEPERIFMCINCLIIVRTAINLIFVLWARREIIVQSLPNDVFTASFFLTLWRPFHLGQTIEIIPENLSGRVSDRNLMFTTLREESGSILQIPNNLFFQKPFRVSGETASSWLNSHKEVRAPSIAQS